jgi:hypothetical protein
MDHMIVPDIVWEEPSLSRVYAPCAGDVLITLDVNNFAETSFWTGRRPPTHIAIRGAWILAVETVRSSEVGSASLDAAWASAGFRVLSVYQEAEGGSWAACDTVPMRFSSLLAPHGLGWADATEPSAENFFVVLHTNNFPVSAPVLQACWWYPGYVSRFMRNSWVLGIVDVPSKAGPTTRTLSCWVCGRGLTWTQDGMQQSYTLPAVQRSPSDRVELEVMPLTSQSGTAASDICMGTQNPPSTGDN